MNGITEAIGMCCGSIFSLSQLMVILGLGSLDHVVFLGFQTVLGMSQLIKSTLKDCTSKNDQKRTQGPDITKCSSSPRETCTLVAFLNAPPFPKLSRSHLLHNPTQ